MYSVLSRINTIEYTGGYVLTQGELHSQAKCNAIDRHVLLGGVFGKESVNIR